MLNQFVLIVITSVLGVLGLSISIIASLIGGVGLSLVFLRAMISGISMVVLGTGAYFILEWQIPSLWSLNKNKVDSDGSSLKENNLEESLLESEIIEEEEIGNKNSNLSTDNNYDNYDNDDLLNKKNVNSDKKSFVSEDTVVVEGVALQNKPELMGNAIQHLLDQDED